MHPDQTTPDSHRYQSSDSKGEPRPPDVSQDSEAIDESGESAVPAAAPEVDEGARVAEAGNAYVGRQMDDDLKTNPRLEDGDEAVDEDPSTAGDD